MTAAPDNSSDFRAAMRRLAGGVAIITAAEQGTRFGMTMTAVMSLSMDPPSLAVAINRSASIAAPISRTGLFCVNLLRSAHDGFCAEFSALPTADRFSVGEWELDANGIPYLVDAQANLFCLGGPTMTFGTHDLVVGIVDHVINQPAIEPLVHLDGRYVIGAPAA